VIGISLPPFLDRGTTFSLDSGGREILITEFFMCSRHEQLPHVIGVGPQWATANVRQKATVVCEVRGSQSNKRLMYEPRDLEHNALTDWQAVQLP